MTILDMLRRTGARNPTGRALAMDRRHLTFADLEGGSNAAARVLRSFGVRKGDRVALVADKSLDWVLAYLGALKTGALVVPVNPAWRERELDHVFSHARPRVAVVDPRTVAAVRDAAGDAVAMLSIEDDPDATRAADPGVHPFHQSLRKASFQPIDELVWDRDPALIVYTSGTTGKAKGAILTHGNLAANALALKRALKWSESDRLCHALPLFHVHGLCVGLHGALLAGSETRFLPFDPDRVIASIRDEKMTLFLGVPTMYSRLLSALGDDREAFQSMRLFVSGSAPLPESLFHRFLAATGHAILERYGMTETLITLCQPVEGEREPGTVGFPLDGIEARIVDDSGRDVADGEVGELWVRGTSVGPGYFEDPDATEASRRDGWFRTGDLAVRESPGGPYRIVGRTKDLIISGGYNVYPREVEDVLRSHPAVEDALVYGVEDADLGEAVAADVVLKAGQAATESELADFAKERIASYKKPRSIRFVENLPENSMGKVVRPRRAP